MMVKTKKLLFVFFLIILLLPVGAVFLASASPKVLLVLAEKLTPYQFSAEEVSFQLFSPHIILKEFHVRNNNNGTVISVEVLDLQTVWTSLLGGKQQWQGEINGGAVFLENIEDSPASDKNKKTDNKPLDLYAVLEGIHVSLHDIVVHLQENNSLFIKKLEKHTGLKSDYYRFNFSMALLQKQQEKELLFPVEGELSALMTNGTPELQLSIPQLDIRPLMSYALVTEPNKAVSNVSDKTVEPDKAAEEVIDWSWLYQLAPLTVALKSEKIQLLEGELTDIDSALNLKVNSENKQLALMQTHKFQLQYSYDNSFEFDQQLQLNSNLQWLGKETQGADFSGVTELSFADNKIEVQGDININGVAGNKLTLNTVLDTLPVKALSPAVEKINQQFNVLFPFSKTISLQAEPHQIVFSDALIKAGTSDVKGNATLRFSDVTMLEAVSFDLSSQQLMIPDFPKAESKSEQVKTEKIKTSVFNEDKIDFRWLDVLVQGQWDIGKMIYQGRLLMEGFSANANLDKKKFLVNAKADSLADGKLNMALSLDKQNENLLLKTNASLKNAKLGSLALLPEDEFKEGVTDLTFDLATVGNSTKALSSQLNGTFLLVSKNGEISNNSFELIGSDLILKLLNTINPFHKKVKQTTLECAVVHSKIENGKLLFNDSVAVKTSNMVVIADGNVDLTTEKINLGINPKARSGIGVDIASLAKFVALKGTLSKPEMGASASGTLKSVVKLGAALSTGGLSMIADGLTDKATSGDACENALNAF